MTTHRIVWGAGGHDREWMLHLDATEKRFLDPYNYDYIDLDFVDELEALLSPSGFYILNRGTRLEIHPPSSAWEDRANCIVSELAHTQVKDAVTQVFGGELKIIIIDR